MSQQIDRDNLIVSLKGAYCCKCSDKIQSTCRGETCIQQEQIIAEHDKEVRGKVLDELGKILNSRIAKMEILDSKNPTPFRKGIIEAYRDIENWERTYRRKAGEQR